MKALVSILVLFICCPILLAQSTKVGLPIGHLKPILFAGFSSDNKFILTTSVDMTSIIWDTKTGFPITQLIGHKGQVTFGKFSSDNRMVGTISSAKEVIVWDTQTGKPIQSWNSFVLEPTELIFSPDNRYLASVSKNFELKIWDLQEGYEIKFNGEQPVARFIQFDRSEPIISFEDYNLGNVSYRISSNQLLKTTRNLKLNNDEQFLRYNSIGNDLFRSEYTSDSTIYYKIEGNKLELNFANKSAPLSLENHLTMIKKTNFLPLINSLVVLYSNGEMYLKKWSANGAIIESVELADSVNQFELCQHDKQIYFVKSGHLISFDLINQRSDTVCMLTRSVDQIVSANIPYHIVLVGGQEIQIVDVANKAVHYSYRAEGMIESAELNDSLLYVKTNSTAKLIKWRNETDWFSFEDRPVSSIYSRTEGKWHFALKDKIVVVHQDQVQEKKFMGDSANLSHSIPYNDSSFLYLAADRLRSRIDFCIYFPGRDSVLHIGSQRNVEIIDFEFVPEGEIWTFSDKSKVLLRRSSSGDQYFIGLPNILDPQTSVKDPYSNGFTIAVENELFVKHEEFDSLRRFKLSTKPRELYYLSKDLLLIQNEFLLTLLNVKSGEFIYVVSLDDRPQDEVWLANDNYYMSKGGAIARLFFIDDLKVYSISQFDLKYNRPDKIVERTQPDNNVLQFKYYQAFLRRLKKYNLSEFHFDEDFHTPEVEVKNHENLESENTSGIVQFQIRASDNKYILKQLNVTVNNVPVHGRIGLPLRGNVADTIIEIELTEGRNTLEISVMNERGVESRRETYFINCTKHFPESKTYFVGLGSERYSDQSKDLSYAVKDIREVSEIFSNQSLNTDVEIDTFYNQQITKTSIEMIKERLLPCSIHDQVIFMFSGHGLLDESMNFYLATFDVDFKNPNEFGISFESIDELMDVIPARRKLILIDACHSGEIDMLQEDVEMPRSLSDSKSSGRLFENLVSSESTFELMKELFSDLRRGTGATVISSSSGDKSSYENNKYKNGFFTYALKEGLKGSADLNGNGEIVVSELKNYLYNRVYELSDGKQKPTARQENIEFDYRVY